MILRSERDRRRYCRQACLREAKRRTARQSNAARPRPVRCEKNIVRDYRGKYIVRAQTGGRRHYGEFESITEARAFRDGVIADHVALLRKRCPVCGKRFTAKSPAAVYCSRACGEKAREQGILVLPAKAKPANRRKWKQAQKAQREEHVSLAATARLGVEQLLVQAREELPVEQPEFAEAVATIQDFLDGKRPDLDLVHTQLRAAQGVLRRALEAKYMAQFAEPA